MKARWIAIVIAALLCVPGLAAFAAATSLRTLEAPSSHTEHWLALHGRDAVTSLEGCRDCHSELSCRSCHLAEWPHPDSWQRIHGPEASESRYRGCMLCHDQSYCAPCHGGVEVPHPSDYAQAHTKLTSGDEPCAICHLDADCTPCHARHGSHNAGGLLPR